MRTMMSVTSCLMMMSLSTNWLCKVFSKTSRASSQWRKTSNSLLISVKICFKSWKHYSYKDLFWSKASRNLNSTKDCSRSLNSLPWRSKESKYLKNWLIRHGKRSSQNYLNKTRYGQKKCLSWRLRTATSTWLSRSKCSKTKNSLTSFKR